MLIVCWDYDGTLVSSELIYKNIFVNYLSKNGYVIKNIDNDYYFTKYAGKHPFTVLEQLKKDGYVDKNTEINVDELNLIFQKELSKSDDLLLTDGIVDVLNDITKHKNTFMAIVTSTYRIDFEAKFNNPGVKELKQFFDVDKNVYICGEVGTKQLKPNPNGYIFAYEDIVKKFNLKNDKKDCFVMVEDSISGCKSGSNAKEILKDKVNCTVVGYIESNKFVSEENIKNAGADVVIKTSKELAKFMDSLIKNN